MILNAGKLVHAFINNGLDEISAFRIAAEYRNTVEIFDSLVHDDTTEQLIYQLSQRMYDEAIRIEMSYWEN